MNNFIEETAKCFADKVVIVTGAGRGMGKQIAINFAKQGANLVINDINQLLLEQTAKELAEFNIKLIAIIGDMANSCDCELLVKSALNTFDKIDILINNAAIAPLTRPLELINDEEWNKVINVDLNGVFYCMRAVIPHMKSRNYGKIINISSSAGRSISTFAGAHYTAAKAGVLGLTRHAAYEAAPFNLNINAIAPGTIDTDLLRESASVERLSIEASKIPMRRLGTTQDIYLSQLSFRFLCRCFFRLAFF